MKIFKDQNGSIRSGWIIIICLVFLYILNYAFPEIIIFILGKVFVATGDINYATNYYSPLISRINNSYLPLGFQFLNEIVMISISLVTWKILKYPIQDIGLNQFKLRFKKDGIFGMLAGILGCSWIFLFLLYTGNVKINGIDVTINFTFCAWLLVFVLVGIAEELFNRGLIMSLLRKTNNKYLIVGVPSILFGLIHLGNPGITVLSIVNIILIGLVFSYMYYKSGNLWMCIGYHITWNIFQSMIYGMPVSGLNVDRIISSNYPMDNLLNGGYFGIEGGLLTTINTLFIFVGAYYFYKKSSYQFLNPNSLNSK